MGQSMTLEVGETIEPGQSMVMDSSVGRVYKLKMDKRGSILGIAAEKFYIHDIITLKKGTQSTWELYRDENGEIVIPDAKNSPRRLLHESAKNLKKEIAFTQKKLDDIFKPESHEFKPMLVAGWQHKCRVIVDNVVCCKLRSGHPIFSEKIPYEDEERENVRETLIIMLDDLEKFIAACKTIEQTESLKERIARLTARCKALRTAIEALG
jgi:hypothetical protein